MGSLRTLLYHWDHLVYRAVHIGVEMVGHATVAILAYAPSNKGGHGMSIKRKPTLKEELDTTADSLMLKYAKLGEAVSETENRVHHIRESLSIGSQIRKNPWATLALAMIGGVGIAFAMRRQFQPTLSKSGSVSSLTRLLATAAVKRPPSSSTDLLQRVAKDALMYSIEIGMPIVIAAWRARQQVDSNKFAPQ